MFCFFLQLSTKGYGDDLTGTVIEATKPVAVVSGNSCAFIPETSGVCDAISEFEIPTNSWGTEYLIPFLYGRKNEPILKIFAKEPKTKIFRDHEQVGYIEKAGGTKDIGWLEMPSDTGTARPVIISGDKPINVVMYNQGPDYDTSYNYPAQLNLSPLEQYQKEVSFKIGGSQLSPYDYILLIYEGTETGELPDEMQFAQVISGTYEWIKLKELSPTPGTPYKNVNSGKKYYLKHFIPPGEGVYKLRNNKPFAAYIQNNGKFNTQLFQTQAVFGDLTIIDTLPPEPKWILDSDGTVNVMKTEYVTDKPDDEQDRTNMSCIYLHTDVSYNYNLYHGDFMPCEVQTVPWRLEIIDNREDAYAVVTFADCAGNDTTVYILFSLPKLAYSEEKILFENCKIDSLYEALVYLKNMSVSGKSTINEIGIIDSINGFTVLDTNRKEMTFPMEIPIGDSLPLIVQFRTSISGKFIDTLFAYSPCSFYFKIPLIAYTEGTGVDDKRFDENINIIPNPASEQVTIIYDMLISDIKVFDILGCLQNCPKDIEEGRSIVNISELNDGVYFIQMLIDNRVLVRKFIVRKME